jgi:biopolymer transport protein ExbD
MRLSSRKIQHGSKIELSMTSMIDVVFLLLIFFMTTMSFVKTERALSPGIRIEEKTTQTATRDLEPAIVIVDRGASGRFVYRLGTNEFDSHDELAAVLAQFENKIDGAFVRVSDDAPFWRAAAAVQACKSAGFPGVSYVPLESSP